MRRAVTLAFPATVALGACVSPLPGSGGELTGNAGAGQEGGHAGAASMAGSGGFAGSAVVGSGGSVGSGGGGSAAPFSNCPPIRSLDCDAPVMLKDGHVTSFSPQEWSPVNGRYCNASGLSGSIFSYSGPAGGGSSNAASVDAAAGNLRLALTAGPGGFAGGGITFDRCVAASAQAFRFTAWLGAGDLTNCHVEVQFQTFDQRPTTQSPPGGCDSSAGSCYQFPTSRPLALPRTPLSTVVRLDEVTVERARAARAWPSQIVGLQWQIAWGSEIVDDAQTPCAVEIRIDDVDFL